MNAMIFAAGKGTRLRPLTDTLPKALVPVNGKPLLQYVLDKLRRSGFDNIVVNAHHHADQIIDYLKDTGVKTSFEPELLDTGGGLRAALPLFGNGEAVLVHNVDILSNADLRRLYAALTPQEDACLLVSERETKRYLLFDNDMKMAGWTNKETGEVRSPYGNINPEDYRLYAFSGIQAVSQRISRAMKAMPERFSITDFYIRNCGNLIIKGVVQEGFRMIDAGKPDSLRKAETFFQETESNT